MSVRTTRSVVLSLALCAAMASLPAVADHERRGGHRGGHRGGPQIGLGLGLAGAFGSGWVGVDGLALAVGDQFDSTGDPDRPRPLGVRLRAGSDLSRRFGMEVHAGYGRDSSVASFDRVDTWVVGGFLRGGVPLGRAVQLNGLLGLGAVGVSQTVDNSEFSDSNGGLAFGFNMDVKLAPRTSLTGGWTRYAGGDGIFAAVSGWSLGIKIGYY